MAHHQQTNHDMMLAAQPLSSNGFQGSAGTATTSDDELASDLDEPPDEQIQFTKMQTSRARNFNRTAPHDYLTTLHPARDRKESLLTQALLSSPELNPVPDTETPMLTSDGGVTSPAGTTSPSPPLPSVQTGLSIGKSFEHHAPQAVQLVPATNDGSPHEKNVEAGLGRKRCISFACGRQSAFKRSTERQPTNEPPMKLATPAKRPCMLRFVCPMKPTHEDTQKSLPKSSSPSPIHRKPILPGLITMSKSPQNHASMAQDSDSLIETCPSRKESPPPPSMIQSRKGKNFNRVDFQKSEATRFFEFGCHFDTEDEWTNEQTAFRQKITVNDTLRKENAIRKLADEAEEEALDEEAEGDFASDQDDGFLSDGIENPSSDDGNESDDEHGFAESDDESDGSSDYQFWTPGLTTAATSTEQLEHIRPIARRMASDSSIGSVINTQKIAASRAMEGRHLKSPKMRPGTPDLPDTSDFVVGTVDEDRPLEEAYMSCLEERRRSKHQLLPQDIDPSFPTSEPDGENNDDRADSENDSNSCSGNSFRWVRCHMETLEDKASPIRTQDSMSSPGPLQSPPTKPVSVHRSPPPRRLFGQRVHRLRSPPPANRKLMSPPSSRRPSLSGSPSTTGLGIHMPHLAQRPNLTHTTSLPRTPNPFWGQHRQTRLQGTETPSVGTSPKYVSTRRNHSHTRGPIDIVQGLEAKRQRRKEKFWRQHCRTAGKEKHRRCQPGKGAERMKELGLEMADRCRGYGQRTQLVLSI